MPPLLEVAFEGAATPVRVVATNFALILDAQAVQFVEPERNRLPVPTERQIQRVVDWSFLIINHLVGIDVHTTVHVLIITVVLQVSLHLSRRLTLLLLKVLNR